LLLLEVEEAGALLPPVPRIGGNSAPTTRPPSARSLRARQATQNSSRYLLRNELERACIFSSGLSPRVRAFNARLREWGPSFVECLVRAGLCADIGSSG